MALSNDYIQQATCIRHDGGGGAHRVWNLSGDGSVLYGWLGWLKLKMLILRSAVPTTSMGCRTSMAYTRSASCCVCAGVGDLPPALQLLHDKLHSCRHPIFHMAYQGMHQSNLGHY